MGASQVLSETSLEEGEQTDIEDEDEAQAEASSLCAAEPEEVARSRAEGSGRAGDLPGPNAGHQLWQGCSAW